MLKGASYNQDKRFRIMALTDSLPTLTAYSNDVSYESVFVEQLKNFAQPGDVVMGISSSGTIQRGSRRGIRELEWLPHHRPERTGWRQAGPDRAVEYSCGHPHTGRIEDAHMIVCHMIGYYFMERECA